MNGNFRKLSRSAWLTACSAILLAGCGGEDPQRADGPAIDRTAATRLAATSDEIAELIDQGDECTAAHQADELLAAVREEIAAGTVPPALAPELEANAQALQNEVNCEPPPQPDEEETGNGEGEDEGEGEGEDEGKDKEKKEKGKEGDD